MLKVACQGCGGGFFAFGGKSGISRCFFCFFPTFEGVLDALKQGVADRAVLPVENSEAGRVADCHILLPARAFLSLQSVFAHRTPFAGGKRRENTGH